MEPQQQPAADPLAIPPGYISQQRYDTDSVMSKHLDTSDVLEKLKNDLMSYEFDEETNQWKPATRTVYDKEGKAYQVEEPPLMDPADIRTTISYLQMFLNPNTFLSQISEDAINNIMWTVSRNLGIFFYNLRHKLNSQRRELLWDMIEQPIFLGLNRAHKKITLDAVSKTQQSHEIIQATPKAPKPEGKDFKFFGNW